MLVESICIGLLIAACLSLLPAQEDDSFPGVLNLNPNSVMVLQVDSNRRLHPEQYDRILKSIREMLTPMEERLGFRTPVMVLHQDIKLAGRVTLDSHQDILEWMRERDEKGDIEELRKQNQLNLKEVLGCIDANHSLLAQRLDAMRGSHE